MSWLKKWIIGLFISSIKIEDIARVLAGLIAKLLRYASKNGGDSWDKAKKIIVITEGWLSIFNKIYEDDTMTAEEEELLADAIASTAAAEKLQEIIKKIEIQ